MALCILSARNTFVLVAVALFATHLASAASAKTQRQAADSAQTEEPEPEKHMGSPKVLKLERQSVILPKTAPRAGKRKNFYSAKVGVGQPGQQFHVSFDLGGGTVVLPAQSCTDAACLERRRYDRWESKTAEDIQANGQLVEQNKPLTLLRRRDRGTLDLHSIDIGAGKVKGTFVRDQVCVGDKGNEEDVRCFPLAMLVANTMQDMPFSLEPYDGTVGLGLAGMSLSEDFNFLAGFHRGYHEPLVYPNSFGLHIGGDDEGGEITFGGYDTKRLTHPLKWAAVADPQEGRWQVAISAIRVGNNTIDACKNRTCRAAIDYSSSLFAVPPNLASGLETVLAFESSPSGFVDGCQLLSIPDIHLELESGTTLTLPSEDFVNDFGTKSGVTLRPSCEPHLTHHHAVEPLGQDMFILGESTLRRYYTFFDADSLSVGFSLAAGAPSKGANNLLKLGNGKEDDKKGKQAPKGDPVILLVQVKLVRSKTVA
jgi:hypothetical protein